MSHADAARVAELEEQLFAGDGPWPASAFHDEIDQPHTRYIVARDAGGQVIGYAGLALLGGSLFPESEVHTIGTGAAWQGRGVGRALLGELLAAADKHGGPVFLEVRVDNEPAIALYRRSGFEIAGLRKRYYPVSGADAHTMVRPAQR
jgi:ribosomal-protein-alanine N-acetyltransferase